MTSSPIRLILVDDHKIVCESWNLLLGYDNRFSIIHECDNGQEAIEHTLQLSPDILLVDINMYPSNGFEVAKKVLEANPSVKIIGISVNNQPSCANRMLEIGGMGFIAKGSPFEEVTHAIIEVYKGTRYVCNEIKNIINNSSSLQKIKSLSIASLSSRLFAIYPKPGKFAALLCIYEITSEYLI